MKARNVWFLVALAIVATIVASRFVRAQAEQMSANTWLITFQDTNQDSPPITMMALFTGTGQIISSHGTDFGFLSPAGKQLLKQACGRGSIGNNERHTPAYGSWSMNGIQVRFMVISLRFDPNGSPDGFLRAEGTGTPNVDGTVQGNSRIDFLDHDANPVTGKPICGINTTFTGQPIPSSPPVS